VRRAIVVLAAVVILGFWMCPVGAQTAAPTGSTAVTAPATSSGDRLRILGFVGFILVCVVYLRLAEQPAREPRSLVKFGKEEPQSDTDA
jgi:hypothetical protein